MLFLLFFICFGRGMIFFDFFFGALLSLPKENHNFLPNLVFCRTINHKCFWPVSLAGEDTRSQSFFLSFYLIVRNYLELFVHVFDVFISMLSK